MERATILVADDHPLFREGVVRAVKAWPELELIAEAADGRSALALIHELSPSVAVVDLRLPGLDGIEIAQAVTRDKLATRVLLLTAHSDEVLVYRALQAGASGYVTKDATQEQIARSIHAVSLGKMQISPELAGGLARQIRQSSRDDVPILSERERQVLVLLCNGLSAPQIAQRLFLGTSTIKSHLSHLYEKLGVTDRAAAVAQGMRHGLVE
jgi:two-component system nitrate/nitrite response regulator NarL